MSRPITAFVPYSGNHSSRATIEQLQHSDLVEKVVLLTPGPTLKGCESLAVVELESTRTINAIANAADTYFTLLVLNETEIEFGKFALERFLFVAESTVSGIVYSDYYDMQQRVRTPHPTTEYQEGSVRDDFDFGSVLFMNSVILRAAAAETRDNAFVSSGLYALRLAISRQSLVTRIGEFLYARIPKDTRKTGERQFDYVDPRNRQVQIERETAVSEHLKKVGAFLAPHFQDVDLKEGSFPFEASIIIPVKNRVRTIGDAIGSALTQQTDFPFNIIVIDNQSADGTSEVIRSFAEKDARVVHYIPAREDLGIGGCWNEAVHHPMCGRFAVQLDSDDLYKDPTTLRRIVTTFHAEKCAMVIGSYQMTNFDLEEIPPGIIDHREWTPENGRNNALRVNGLGAPRAFFTSIIRRIKFPNVSYGEDYAVGLAVSRDYPVGRIFDPLYLCRRWEGNSDANLDIVKSNAFNHYKDKVRTLEILARQRKNAMNPAPKKSRSARARQR